MKYKKGDKVKFIENCRGDVLTLRREGVNCDWIASSFKEKNSQWYLMESTIELAEPIYTEKENKYKVDCNGTAIDVYDVLVSFKVTNPAIQHAIKKLLKGGDRGYKDTTQDYNEAMQSIARGIEIEEMSQAS